jgi:ferrochelatase
MTEAILLVSFGGPEGRDDVIPFLENVLRGRNVPRERMLEVAEHYNHYDGVSPINGHNRALLEALRQLLAREGPQLPVYWGNRNWHPMLTDTMAQMRADGIERAYAFVTSAFSSYSGCRQYRENIAAAGDGPEVLKLRVYFNHPGFIDTMIDNARAEIAKAPDAALVFTAHSIPMTMAESCKYVAQLNEACRLVAQGVGRERFQLAFQSRSGPPTQPWLAPDINGVLREIQAEAVVVVPIGFVSDHMEVIHDLDTEARATAESRGLTFYRAATAGCDPRFVAMIRELVLERRGEAAHDDCPLDCCPAPAPARQRS